MHVAALVVVVSLLLKIKMPDIKVKETKRSIFFSDGSRAVFNNVTWFNSDGSYLRLGCDEGYVLINSKNVNYIVVDGERVK